MKDLNYDPEKTNLIELFLEQSFDFVFRDERRLRRLIMAHLKTLSVADVAYLLGKSERTIKRWIKVGKWRMPVNDEGEHRMTPKAFEREFDRVYKYKK